VPGARCFGDVRGLFGGAASTLTVDGARVIPLPDYPDGRALETAGVLFSLAATAQHAFVGGDLPDLIVGHGVLGRLLARIALAHGASPTVWEIDADRAKGAEGYTVLHPDADGRKDYRAIYDASGAGAQLDAWIGRLAKGGEIVLAGFYDQPLSFTFPPAFMREARFRIAAEFTPEDLATVSRLIAEGRLSLDGLVTHTGPASAADAAYRTAFADPACLKMVLDWRNCS
jgi:3-hydroxyethyl bacteriochlorophyllide a dehydrogenase